MMKRRLLWIATGFGCIATLLFAVVGCSYEGRNIPSDQPTPEGSRGARHLSVEEAKEIALTFLTSDADIVPSLRSLGDELTLAFAEPTSTRTLRANDSSSLTDSRSGLPAYYIFNVGDKGYVIVSAWDVTYPVLGFSEEGAFFSEEEIDNPEETEVENVMSFLSSYAFTIDSLRQVTPVTQELRSAYLIALDNVIVTDLDPMYFKPIAPLLGGIRWRQLPHYNAYCPEGTPVGCVATAATQIMKYWGHPVRGTGSHTSTFDGQVANFNKIYNWDKMPAGVLTRDNHEIAQLSYDVAVGLNMNFGPKGSGTSTGLVPQLLKDHFYYKNTARIVWGEDYTYNAWQTQVYLELKEKRPVQYAGVRPGGGGHSFVCDGFRRGYFHINWGWGGKSNGYFLLHELDPKRGASGSKGGFKYGQYMVIGIEPAVPASVPAPHTDPYPISYAKDSYTGYIREVKMGYDMVNRSGGNNYTSYVNDRNYKIMGLRGLPVQYTLTPGFENNQAEMCHYL